MDGPLTVLGIESSCDDTAAAVLRAEGEGAQILSSVVLGQEALHAAFGGVVPEIAARAHVEKLDLTVEAALEQAGVTLGDLDAIAVTAGPGLIGGVLSGVMLAKGLAAATGLPLIGVNHLAGHALTPRLTTALLSPTSCCWSRAGIASSCGSRGRIPSPASAEPSTTRQARPSTRLRSS